MRTVKHPKRTGSDRLGKMRQTPAAAFEENRQAPGIDLLALYRPPGPASINTRGGSSRDGSIRDDSKRDDSGDNRSRARAHLQQRQQLWSPWESKRVVRSRKGESRGIFS
jgi:hypothetical protein